jgi:predicted small secreted protein
MKNACIIVVCATALLLTAGCSTTAGFGEDLESTGEAITKTSEDARK